MPRPTPKWTERLERAAIDYFFDERERDFSLAAVEKLAARHGIRIPAGASLRTVRTAILKRVRSMASLAGVRTDGIKLDAGKAPPKTTSRNGMRLLALRTQMRWSEAGAAKRFGVPLARFKEWERGGRMWDSEARLLTILESPARAGVRLSKGAAGPPPRAWKLSRRESRRLLALMTRRGWSVASACTAFGVGSRTIGWWLDGAVVMKGASRKILEFYEEHR